MREIIGIFGAYFGGFVCGGVCYWLGNRDFERKAQHAFELLRLHGLGR